MLGKSIIRDVTFKQKLGEFFTEKADILRCMPRGYTNSLANEFRVSYPEYDLISVEQFRNQLDRWRRKDTPADFYGCGMNYQKKMHLDRVARVKEFLKSIDPSKLYSQKEEYAFFINSAQYEGQSFRFDTYRVIRREIKKEVSTLSTPSDNSVKSE